MNLTECVSAFTKVDDTLKLLDTKFEASIITGLLHAALKRVDVQGNFKFGM